MARLLILDDHPMVRLGIETLLSSLPGIAQVTSVSSVTEARAALTATPYDLAVVDLTLGTADGSELIDWMLAFHPHTRVVVHTVHPEDGLAVRLLRRGVAAYVHKGRDPDVLLAAVQKALRGGRYLTDELAERLLSPPSASASAPHESLSAREMQVFLMAVDGRPPAHIAAQLHLSRSTVSTHLRAIREKLGASSLHDLVNYAHRVGLR